MAKHVVVAVVAAVLAMAAGSALADDQAPASQPARHGPMVRGPMGMLAELNLTDDQKARIKDILAAAKAQAEKATDPKDKLDAVKAALDTIHKDVLTDDQRKQLEQLKAKVDGVFGVIGGFLEKLNVTDDQKAKIKDIFAAAKAQAEQATDPKDKMGAFKAALDTIQKDVLTDDQRKQLEALKAKGEQLRQDLRQRGPAPAAEKAPA